MYRLNFAGPVLISVHFRMSDTIRILDYHSHVVKQINTVVQMILPYADRIIPIERQRILKSHDREK